MPAQGDYKSPGRRAHNIAQTLKAWGNKVVEKIKEFKKTGDKKLFVSKMFKRKRSGNYLTNNEAINLRKANLPKDVVEAIAKAADITVPEFRQYQKIARTVPKSIKEEVRIGGSVESRAKWQEAKPEIKALNWIGDNSSKVKYGGPEGVDLLKADYEAKFGKVGTDPIFNKGKEGEKIRQELSGVKNLKNPDRTYNLLHWKKGFSEDEVFKAAIIQNNKPMQTKLKNAFGVVHRNKNWFSELSAKGMLDQLGRRGAVLSQFDWVDETRSGKQTYGGVQTGITRQSLRALDIPEEQLESYQWVRKPLRALRQIVDRISDPRVRKEYGLTLKEAKHIQRNFDKIEKGRTSLKAWLADAKKIMGPEVFEGSLGKVNFET